ncbi:MAG: nodulation protein NfeD [Bacteroidetes bacterium]|nr:nodulation protein NfeD [Bacteroidota bacterium]MBS1975011.1 nodulation protein NfeD [Bacteroidota bacterium]
MKHVLRYCFFLFLPGGILAQTAVAIKIDGTINPASADFIHNSLEKAQKENAACFIIHLNTPGGLLESTRSIVRDLLQSDIPVVVYISPAGAHAGSAGVFVAMASNVVAMAPGTNIGAAHPVVLNGSADSVMNEKMINDASAFLRSIAQKRGRDIQWAEDVVSRSVSITENEALNKKLIDIIATNDKDLLDKLDGMTAQTSDGAKTLRTKSAIIKWYSMNSIEKLLNLISDPNIAYILMMLGIFGILFEFYNPGAILPGVVGGIAIILAFYSFQAMPLNYAGLALIAFGIVLFLLEIKIASHGILTIGGAASLLLGSLMLIRPTASLNFERISIAVILSAVGITLLFFLFVIGMGIRAQRNKIQTGADALADMVCEVIATLNPSGTVMVNGEIWNAESLTGPISQGEKARIKEMKGLRLYVEKLNS